MNNEKKLINGAEALSIHPIKYQWAMNMFNSSNTNFWLPSEVDMGTDVYNYKHKITDQEKHVIEHTLAYLSTADVVAMTDIPTAFSSRISAPEAKLFLSKQEYDEAVHTLSYQHILETMGIDEQDVYNRYKTVPEIRNKIEFSTKMLMPAMNHNNTLSNDKEILDFLHAYYFFAVMFEGTYFFNGFTPVYAIHRNGNIPGIAGQFAYIQRDEALHCSYGMSMILNILKEHPHLSLDPEWIANMFIESEQHELDYAKLLLGEGQVTGYSVSDHMRQFRYTSNLRANYMKSTIPFTTQANALAWVDTFVSQSKLVNFFESRNTEYQTAVDLKWSTVEYPVVPTRNL